MSNAEKSLKFIGSAQRDLQAMPAGVQDEIGYALDVAQFGGVHPDAKPMRGFGGGVTVMEITARDSTDTYRGVYTAKFEGIIYVLHCFQKKSKSGIKTPQQEIDLIHDRLKTAREHYAARNK